MRANTRTGDVPGRTIFDGSPFDRSRSVRPIGQEVVPGVLITLTQTDASIKKMSDRDIERQALFASRETTRVLTSRRAYLNREESTDE